MTGNVRIFSSISSAISWDASRAARIPVISGLPKESTSDQLKALCAASAASGGVELLHVVGVDTRGAHDWNQFSEPAREPRITAEHLKSLHRELSEIQRWTTGLHRRWGTPHFSLAEFSELVKLLDGRKIKQQLYIFHQPWYPRNAHRQGLAQGIARCWRNNPRRCLHLLFTKDFMASRAA
jgi:predicted aconitase